MFDPPLRATNHCRHYSYEGGLSGGPRCAVGINFGDGPSTAPCMPASQLRPPCVERQEYTDVEREAWRAWMAERSKRMLAVMAELPGSADRKKPDNKWGQGGVIECPACTAGKVRWSRARTNGHLWAACSTPNCFSVMQ